MFRMTLLAAITASLIAVPAAGQAPAGPPGKADVSRVAAGTYKIDAHHTQVLWEVDHLGLTPLWGMFGEASGSLTLDPANLGAAKVVVDFPLTGLTVSSAPFGKHLRTPDLFDAEKFPAAKFVSTLVKVSGTKATITGDLTVKGITKPVTLQASFYGAGLNPMSKAETVGFTATGKINRSAFGLGYGVPNISDDVTLKIVAAFEKQG